MLREEKILAELSRDMRFLEIGPSYNPIVPKRDGWKAWTADHTTREGLVEKYQGHAGVDVSRIEDVDFVWAGGPLDSVVPTAMKGTIDALIASHVIEHIPDFVSFFSSAVKLLSPRGIVSLAVPDKRFCFDYFRPHSTTGQIIEAHRQKSGHHRPAAHFDHMAYVCKNDGAIAWGQHPIGDVSLITPTLTAALEFFENQPSTDYVDCHGWQFTPSSFELIVLELAALGLIDFHVVRSFPSEGCEFIVQLTRVPTLGQQCVQLQKKESGTSTSNELLQAKRLELLERIVEELGQQADYLRVRSGLAQTSTVGVDLPLVESLPVRAPSPTNNKSRNKIWAAAKYIAKVIPPINRVIEQRNQLAEELNQLTEERNKIADERNRPVVSVSPSKDGRNDRSPKIHDRYTDEAPSAANAFRIFAGEWSSAVPGFETGKALLFDNSRIKWLEKQSGGFSGKRILELGPLEGGHTYMMERAGATVVAIESNQRAFLKCLVVKEALGLNAKFLYGDVRPYLRTCNDHFDFVLASGVLYHMTQPADLLRDMSRVATSFGIWTHYYDEAIVRSRGDLREKFDQEPIVQIVDGRAVTVFRQRYLSALASTGFCGGSESTSCWFTKDGLLKYLQELGFEIKIGDNSPNHQNGPCILLFVRRP